MEFVGASGAALAPNQLRMMKSLRATIKTITTERGGLAEISREHHLNGSFKQLCNKKLFTELLFPGTTAGVLEGLPKDLREVLQWEDLELDLEKISKNATDVLESIKNKGRSSGDVMDETTEFVLLPQIGQEALAKGIIEAVRRLSRRVSQMSAKVSQAFASPTAPQAELDQLDDEVVGALAGRSRVGVQDEFLGEHWALLIRTDIHRYIANEKLTVLNRDGGVSVAGAGAGAAGVGAASSSSARMCWIEPSAQLSDQYAAIAELIEKMHALPFELNRKWDGVSQLKLLEPAKGCTMLLHYPAGSSQMPRMDSRDDGSDLDSGIRITCSYTLVAAEGEGDTMDTEDGEATQGCINFYDPITNQPIKAVPIMDDALILHQAAKVRNEKAASEHDYFVLIFFMQGKEVPQA
ncbi:hypothetical protein B484DRAFT_451671 [Ochromonadaceae sp. CCMP2298]|nr:hypothetical protein B484DRAFT_451671 [Ochromonadaceae sp. CCMP2298]